jgi:hypothetical protein
MFPEKKRFWTKKSNNNNFIAGGNIFFTLSNNLRLSVAEHVGVVVTLYTLMLAMFRSNLDPDIRYPEHFHGFSQAP